MGRIGDGFAGRGIHDRVRVFRGDLGTVDGDVDIDRFARGSL